ncbi:hypothetical protein ACF0H5_000824 [Mactra antiquata]
MLFHLCLIFTTFVPMNSTVDLNIHQLQLIADHLTDDECTRLVSALRQVSFEPAINSDGISNSDTPCISLLLQYDRTVGFGKTFDDLAFRLGQIGQKELSEKLSQAVYEEKSDELDRYFLNDPYKKFVPKQSLIFDQTDHSTQSPDDETSDRELEREFSDWEIAIISCSGIILTSFVLYAIYKLFGDAIRRMCQNYAPDYLIEWARMVKSEIKWFCKKAVEKYKKNVIGSKVRDGSRQTLDLMELNRNLNNYIHHGAIDAQDYFDELIVKYQNHRKQCHARK